MEVCGRYHHWMPLLVHVVHKDLFLGWCLAYLKLVESRAQSNARAISALVSTDLLSLDATLSKVLARRSAFHRVSQISSPYLVSSDLDD